MQTLAAQLGLMPLSMLLQSFSQIRLGGSRQRDESFNSFSSGSNRSEQIKIELVQVYSSNA
ncbi:MAG: hypothetical protein ABL311_11515 [Nitratireductor rhodophyticola]|uniref:hypothetical protein n=1 Tax=Nitratireductor rhodophyticola TaxID=2854036 RepID=UPI0032D9489F